MDPEVNKSKKPVTLVKQITSQLLMGAASNINLYHLNTSEGTALYAFFQQQNHPETSSAPLLIPTSPSQSHQLLRYVKACLPKIISQLISFLK